VAASRIDRGDNDNCIVASRPATTTRRRAEISVSVIIVMPTIGGAQRELDTHVQNAETLSPARRNPTPRRGAVARARMSPATPVARRVGSSLITSIPTRHPIGPVSSVRLRVCTAAAQMNLTRMRDNWIIRGTAAGRRGSGGGMLRGP